MAQVTLTLTDAGHGLLVKLDSSEPMPVGTQDGGTAAQNLAIIALHYIRREYELVTGREMQEISIC
jgi:hypothetical protein